MSGSAGGMFFSDVDGSGHEAAADEYLRLVAARLTETRRQGYDLLGVSEGWSVLDVGCGLGEVCADLSEIVGVQGRVVGIDASSGLVARAREQWSHLPIEFSVGDAEALDFGDATFDAVRAERVLQHLDRPARAIGEMARVVRPGGRVFVFDPVHDATVVATEHPAVWRALVPHALGGVRQPRAALFFKEWMRAAGLHVDLIPYARLLEDWSTARAVLVIDDAASLAVAEGGLTEAEVETFFAEQQRRADTGVFAASMLAIQALGTKPY